MWPASYNVAGENKQTTWHPVFSPGMQCNHVERFGPCVIFVHPEDFTFKVAEAELSGGWKLGRTHESLGVLAFSEGVTLEITMPSRLTISSMLHSTMGGALSRARLTYTMDAA